jgi:hypothetical protein
VLADWLGMASLKSSSMLGINPVTLSKWCPLRGLDPAKVGVHECCTPSRML